METFLLPDWPRAYGGPCLTADFKRQPEDFLVSEQLGFTLRGQGDFLWLYLEKRQENTQWVAKCLAELSGTPLASVSYAGLKDRQGICRQWFSLPWHARLDAFEWGLPEGVSLLAQDRHPEPIRRGDHETNAFSIHLRNVQGDRALVDARLAKISRQGFPNYFGEQRFGRGGANLAQAQAWFSDGKRPQRRQQGFCLSAVRAYLFNQVLAKRVEQGCWQQFVPGDLVEVVAEGRLFPLLALTADLQRRCENAELVPTGPLPGSGEPKPDLMAAALENQVIKEELFWMQGLLKQRLKPQRRALRAMAQGLSWQWQQQDLLMDFRLQPGAYATALLSELLIP
jgi:tRNA pseudouridine13 synthase